MKFSAICIKFLFVLSILAFSATNSIIEAKKVVLAPSFAWKLIPPLGLRADATIDTLLLNYYRNAIPSAVSPAYALTGNYGAEGYNLIYFDRQPTSEFFFKDALAHWLPSESKMKFYNTRIPMTLVSYNTGGGRDNAQDRLSTTFSGNINKNAQVGIIADYIYSKGSYNYQADKDLTWGINGSYIGDRYEFQGFLNHYNFLNKENGGITDDLYITDPAQVQGGSASIYTKNIPTNLTDSHSKIVGTELYLNNRYKVGFWKEEPVNDTTVMRTYVPVSSFIWTLKYNDNKHIFKNGNASNEMDFWNNHYLDSTQTDDRTNYWALTNTFGISLLEGFNKYAKAGLAAYMTYQVRHYAQTPDSMSVAGYIPEGLTPMPFTDIKTSENQSLMWIGAQLTKQQGTILNYEATAELGIIGEAAGELKINGRIDTHIPLFGDTVSITGYGMFNNVSAPYLLKNYISNHFVWKNDFGKTRTVRFGGILNIPRTGTNLNIGAENVQNLIYFNSNCLPTQHSGSVQIFSATLNQNIRAGILNWDNRITYQTTSDQNVVPLPKLALNSNLYLLFKVAKVLSVQLGIDCDYYTKYRAVNYQPSTMSFYNQSEVECGNYPFMTLYANMKLSKTRFYVMMTHINQGLTGNNYFSMPHYPLNPRRFQLGVSVDFAN